MFHDLSPVFLGGAPSPHIACSHFCLRPRVRAQPIRKALFISPPPPMAHVMTRKLKNPSLFTRGKTMGKDELLKGVLRKSWETSAPRRSFFLQPRVWQNKNGAAVKSAKPISDAVSFFLLLSKRQNFRQEKEYPSVTYFGEETISFTPHAPLHTRITVAFRKTKESIVVLVCPWLLL